MKLEGIVLNKNLVKSNDLICKLLLRSGTCIDIMFYGGAGSKKKKSSIIEIGAMLSVETNERKTGTQSDIKIANEYLLQWRSEHIRYNFKAYSLICFFCELITKISIDFTEESLDSDEHVGLFNVLTNAIFYVDKSVVDNSFDQLKILPLFLVKIFYYMGIFPDISSCRTCNGDLEGGDFVFRGDIGGFVCQNCLSAQDYQGANSVGAFEENRLFKKRLGDYYKENFKEMGHLDAMTKENTEDLINYILYNFQISKESLKSLPMIL